MHWFAFAIVTPILTSFGNLIDKVLTERFVSKESTIWVLSLYSSLFSILVFPIIALVNPQVLQVPFASAVLLGIAGMIEMFSVFLYLNALRDDDASTVVPFFQTIPVFSLVLGFLLLGEVVTVAQAVAGLVVILGGMLIAVEFSEEKKARIKVTLLLLMLSSSFCFALYDALFKFGALQTSFWASVFWQHVGIALLGILIFLFKRSYREDFIDNVRSNGVPVFSLNFVNELLYVVGVGFYSYALLLAPIAIVATATVYQPVFVFVLGLFFTLFFPRVLNERLSLRYFLQKCIALFIIFVASVYLVGTT